MQWQNTGVVTCHSAAKTNYTCSKNTVCRGYWWNFQWQTAKRKHRPKAWGCKPKRVHNWRERDHCGWTARPSKPKRPETNVFFNTPNLLIEMVLTQCSIIQIIYCNLSLKCLVRLPMWLLPVAIFSYICILQGSVATHLRCGEIFNNCFIAYCPRSRPVKKNWKSVNIS